MPKEIYLLKNGKQVEIYDIVGRKKTHPISTLQLPSEEEMMRKIAASGVFNEKLANFYPLHIRSSKDPSLVIQLIMIDWKAKIDNLQLFKAVLNGCEVEV